MALITFATRLVFSLDDEWGYLRPGFFPQYLGLFAAGILARRYEWLPDLPARISKTWTVTLLTSLVVLPILLLPSGGADNPAPFKGGFTWQSLTISTWEQIYGIGMCIALLTLFRRRLDRQGALARLMSANAFAVYMFHPFVVIAMTFVLGGLALLALLKWLLLAPVAVALCFVLCHLLVRRLPLLRRVL